MGQRSGVVRGLVIVALLGTAAGANAVVTVTNTDDSGAGSLRDAIAAAAPGETIVFAPGVTGTIELLSTLEITQPVTIEGPGAALLALDGQSMIRVFDIVVGGELTLTGVTIRGGSTDEFGGGIQNSGGLTVRRCVFIGNTARNGGAIVARSEALTTTIDECTFDANTATSVGGGALLTFGPATATNSTFVRNSGSVNGGAINVQPQSDLTTIINCTFFDNSSGLGGAISNLGTLVILDSTFSENTAAAEGAVIATGNTLLTINNNVFAGNAAAIGPGGAFTPAAGFFTAASNNVFFNNTADGVPDDLACYGTANFVVAPSQPLLPLADNGGPTQTMLPIGAARCAGDVALLPPGLTRDQRGFPRVTSCLDAGAVQVGPGATPAPALSMGSLALALAVLAGLGGLGLRRRR